MIAGHGGVIRVNMRNRTLFSSTYIETMERYADAGTLVDVFLRSNPLGFDIPKEIEKKIRGVRIIYVGADYLVLGPKKPICSTIIPLDEISMVVISDKQHLPDEDLVDARIAQEYPDWERDFARTMESLACGIMKKEGTDSIHELSTQTFSRGMENAEYVVVDVYATWCQPCKEVTAILDELANKYSDRVLFVKVDGDKHEATSEDLGISAYPTVILFKNGEEFKRIESVRSPEYYSEKIEIMLGLKAPGPIKNKAADGEVHEIPADELVEIVERSPVSVIMFYERGDYESQLQSRAVRELAKEYKRKVFFAKVDVDVEEELVEMFEVEDAPELILLMEGDMYDYSESRMTKSELRIAIEEILADYS